MADKNGNFLIWNLDKETIKKVEKLAKKEERSVNYTYKFLIKEALKNIKK